MRRFTRVLLLVALAALVVVPAAFALRFTDDSYNIPQGFTGQPYSKTFDGAGGLRSGPAVSVPSSRRSAPAGAFALEGRHDQRYSHARR